MPGAVCNLFWLTAGSVSHRNGREQPADALCKHQKAEDKTRTTSPNIHAISLVLAQASGKAGAAKR
jgi:hypothetical protein